MGQCLGLDTLQLDVEAFRREHAQLSADLSQLKDDFRHLGGELEEHCEDIVKNMKSVDDAAQQKNAEYALIVSKNGQALITLKNDIVALHKNAVTAAQVYRLMCQELRKLTTTLTTASDPADRGTNGSSLFTDEKFEAYMANMDGKPPTAGTSSKMLSRPSTQFMSRRTVDESPSNSSLDPDSIDNTSSSRTSSRKSRKRSKSSMKRGVTSINMSSHAEMDQRSRSDTSQPFETVTVEFDKGEMLGLMLQRYYKILRNGTSSVAQLIVIGYVSNGISPNPAYQAGIVVEDIICGVNGQHFETHDDLSAALISSYHEVDEARHSVSLLLSRRGDPTSTVSKRRVERAETLAKTKKVVIRSSASRDSKSPASKRKIEHVRKEEHPARAVAKCGLRIWKFVVHRVTTKGFRKQLGKKLRKYCCRKGLASERRGLEHSVSMRHSHRHHHEDNDDNDDDNRVGDGDDSASGDAHPDDDEEYGEAIDSEHHKLDEGALQELDMLLNR